MKEELENLTADLKKAQLLLLEETLSTVAADGLNQVVVTFSAQAGRDFRQYDYRLTVGGAPAADIRSGRPSVGKLSGSTWTVPTTGGPGDAFAVEAHINGRGYALENASARFTYASRKDQEFLKGRLEGLFSGAGQTALSAAVTQKGVGDLEMALAATRLADALKQKLTALPRGKLMPNSSREACI